MAIVISGNGIDMGGNPVSNVTINNNVDVVDKENQRMEKVLIEIEMENGDVMKGELYPEVAPITVENFLKLIDEDFFAGLIFHRVIPGFMIQGGGYTKDFKEK